MQSIITAWKFNPEAGEMPKYMPETHEEAIAWIKARYQDGGYQFGLDNLKSYGVYRLQGWNFNFRPYLKRFVYLQYGQWQECHAPNRTLLRKVVHGKIDQILEASY